MLHEEHMDLFGNVSGTTYTDEVAITNSAVDSNVITIDPTIPNFDAFIKVTQAFTGTSTKLTVAIKGANALSSGDLSSPVTVVTEEIAVADLVLGLTKKYVLPKGYKHIQFTLTPEAGTAESAHAFTAGKVYGYVVPEFN